MILLKAVILFERHYTARMKAMAILELSGERSVEKPWQGSLFRLIISMPATVRGGLVAASQPMPVERSKRGLRNDARGHGKGGVYG